MADVLTPALMEQAALDYAEIQANKATAKEQSRQALTAALMSGMEQAPFIGGAYTTANQYSPALANALLELTPGPGNILSGYDAYQETKDAANESGFLNTIGHAPSIGLGILGAIPAIGMISNAGKMTSYRKAIAEGLDVSNEARFKRAAEMGFRPENYYNGMATELKGGGLELGHPDRHDIGYMGEGLYFSTHPEIANRYVDQKLARTSKERQAPNVLKARLRYENPLNITLDGKTAIASLPLAEREAFLKEVKKAGHDAIVVNASIGGQEVKEVMVFHPNQVRSADSAMFNKADKYSSDLTAAIGGAALLGTFAQDQESK